MEKFKLYPNLNKTVCSKLVDSYHHITTEKCPSTSSIGDSRIFGYERFIDKQISTYLFDLDSNYIFSSIDKRPKYQTLMFNHTYYDDFAKGSGEGWHRDSSFMKQFKTIFYLVSVDLNNGPFKCFINNNIIFDFIFKYKRRFSDDFIKNYKFLISDPKTFISDTPGCGFSINTNLVHRGSPVISGERYAITVYSYLTDPDAAIYKLSTADLKIKS